VSLKEAVEAEAQLSEAGRWKLARRPEAWLRKTDAL
jgi:hypothetical protein